MKSMPMQAMPPAPMPLNPKNYAAAFVFIFGMVALAFAFQDHEIILPEMAALAIGLWVYQDKQWLNQPDKIFLLPSLTATAGYFINLTAMPYALKLVCVLLAMVAIMGAFRYMLGPALATGFLPIVTNATGLPFLVSIYGLSLILMAGVFAFKLNHGIERKANFDPRKVATYAAITLVGIGLAWVLNAAAMAVIPPITVVVYESLNMKMYPLKMCLKQVVVLTFSIALAVLLHQFIDQWLVLSVLYMALAFGLLKLFGMRIPAVYAFPLLVYVFPQDRLLHLPLASLIALVLSLACVYAYHHCGNKPKMG